MNWIKKIKSWRDEKKRIFSIVLALFITITIVVFWIGFGLNKNNEVNTNNQSNQAIDSMKDSFQKIMDEYNLAMSQLASTTELLKNINGESTTSTTTSTSSMEPTTTDLIN